MVVCRSTAFVLFHPHPGSNRRSRSTMDRPHGKLPLTRAFSKPSSMSVAPSRKRNPAPAVHPPPPVPPSQTPVLATDRVGDASDDSLENRTCLRESSPVSRIPPPGYDAFPQGETGSRREAKRWCFTLNNPVQTDCYSEEYPIDPSLLDYLLVANETASTGTPHYQGFVVFKEKKRLSWIIKNIFVSPETGKGRASWFICGGTVEDNIIYCKKGEQPKEEWLRLKNKGPNYGLNANYVEFGEPPSEGRGKGKKNQNTVYAEAFALPTADEALKHLAENAPRDYALQRHNLEKNIHQHYLPKEMYKPKYALSDFNHPGVLFGANLATLVWGPSNVGKTAFVKAHFVNPLFCTHIDALKNFKRFEHDAIIFDDMSFMHMPPETVIHILETDNPASIHCRHRTAEIPAGVVKVFTSNLQNPFYDINKVPECQQEAINRRFKRFHVSAPLFTKK